MSWDYVLILLTRMCSASEGQDVWFLVGPFVYFCTSRTRTAKALARLRMRRLASAFADRLCYKYYMCIISWAGPVKFVPFADILSVSAVSSVAWYTSDRQFFKCMLLFYFQVCFEEVLGEPAGVNSIDCVWRTSYMCFECGKNLCYKILTTLCGICIALYWGCNFAETAFNHVWCYTPCMRDFSIMVGCWQRAFGTVINCCIVPICTGCGHCLSQITITRK